MSCQAVTMIHRSLFKDGLFQTSPFLVNQQLSVCTYISLLVCLCIHLVCKSLQVRLHVYFNRLLSLQKISCFDKCVCVLSQLPECMTKPQRMYEYSLMCMEGCSSMTF